MRRIIVTELREMREQYADARRTEIVDDSTDLAIEDLIAEEDMVVTVSHEGYIKRNPVARVPRPAPRRARQDRRDDQGRGLHRAPLRRLDARLPAVLHHQRQALLDQGARAPAGGPRGARQGDRQPAEPAGADEKVSAFLTVREFQPGQYVLFATKQGVVKKTALDEYANPRPSGIIAIKLNDGDEVIGVRLTDGEREVILSTARGPGDPLPRSRRARRWAATPPACAASSSKRTTRWSRSTSSTPDATLLAVAEKGYGKRTALDEYRLTGRGGKGIITMNVTEQASAGWSACAWCATTTTSC